MEKRRVQEKKQQQKQKSKSREARGMREERSTFSVVISNAFASSFLLIACAAATAAAFGLLKVSERFSGASFRSSVGALSSYDGDDVIISHQPPMTHKNFLFS